MGKLYINKDVSLGECVKALGEADETDLRILCALLLSENRDGEASLAEIEEFLELEATEVNASVKFWKGAGIVSSGARQGGGRQSDDETAHGSGAAPRMAETGGYSNEELAAVLENGVTATFIDEAQRILGKIFNKNDIGKLVGIVDRLGFEEEAVLAILSYCVRIGKKSVSYAERIALSFYDSDISTAEAVHAEIDYIERKNSAVEKVRSLFGYGGRALSATEKRLFTAWTVEWGFSIEIIKKAYDITVDAIHEAAPKYTNSILKKWHDNGLETEEQIDAYMLEERQRSAESKAAASHRAKASAKLENAEIEDWFDERIRQKFGE